MNRLASHIILAIVLLVAYPLFALANTPEPADQFGAISFSQERTHLDHLALLLAKQPNHYAYILKWYNSSAPPSRVQSRQAQVIKYLSEIKHIEKSRIVVINNSDKRERTVY
jgi:hypothetical protein